RGGERALPVSASTDPERHRRQRSPILNQGSRPAAAMDGERDSLNSSGRQAFSRSLGATLWINSRPEGHDPLFLFSPEAKAGEDRPSELPRATRFLAAHTFEAGTQPTYEAIPD